MPVACEVKDLLLAFVGTHAIALCGRNIGSRAYLAVVTYTVMSYVLRSLEVGQTSESTMRHAHVRTGWEAEVHVTVCPPGWFLYAREHAWHVVPTQAGIMLRA